MDTTDQVNIENSLETAISAPELVCQHCANSGIVVRFLLGEFKESCSHCTIFDQQWQGYYNEMRRRFLLELGRQGKLTQPQAMELQELLKLE